MACDVNLSLDAVLVTGVGDLRGSRASVEVAVVEFWDALGPEEMMKLSGLGSSVP